MAVVAAKLFVTAIKRKIGLFVVIENPQSPAVRVMAKSTVLSQCGLVLVIGLMAGETPRFGILEDSGQVTLLAGRGCVQPDKGETRQVVVENDLLRPARLLVTTFAIFTLLATVNVVVSVAGATPDREIFLFECTPVTGGTD
jgi:hypothetical protein